MNDNPGDTLKATVRKGVLQRSFHLERQWQGVSRLDEHGVNKWAPFSISHLNESNRGQTRMLLCFLFVRVTFLKFLKQGTARGAMDEPRTEVTNPIGLNNMHRECVFSCFPVD